jgi:hypothetical protein
MLVHPFKTCKKKHDHLSCIEEIKALLQLAKQYARVKKIGNMSWIAHAVVADIEEFLIDPYGTVAPSSVRKGTYSLNGHKMVNNGLSLKMDFEECLENLVHHVHN